jgi:hypothetical protein
LINGTFHAQVPADAEAQLVMAIHDAPLSREYWTATVLKSLLGVQVMGTLWPALYVPPPLGETTTNV